MGERIKDLAKVKIGESEFRIELNEAYYKSGRYDIHLQNDYGRIGISDQDFLKIATCFMVAKKQFIEYKELKEDE